MRKAYFPLDVRTLLMPSSYVRTNTCFLELMNSHILLYSVIWDFCKKQERVCRLWGRFRCRTVLVNGYHLFGMFCCLFILDSLMMEAAGCSEKFVTAYQSSHHHPP
jgi:hypothetical protein